MSDWQRWIGRSERRDDTLTAGLAARWLGTIDRDAPGDGAGPQGLHWCLCVPDAPTAALGPDGHPRRDESAASFLPPVPLPRRMWASSEVAFLAPLRVGAAIVRTSTVATVTTKQGGTGTLVFVGLVHETLADGVAAVRETQTIVYREPAPAGAPPAPPPPGPGRFDPAGWDAHRVLAPGEPLLFRFSALTFNSHRIHYDLPYAMAEEGYRGLVVHGPLTATLLLDLARRQFGEQALARFAFRGVSPAIAGEPLHLVLRGGGDAIELAAFAGDGRQVMAATGALAK